MKKHVLSTTHQVARTTKIYYLTVLEARSPRQKCWQDWLFLRAGRETLFHALLLAFGGMLVISDSFLFVEASPWSPPSFSWGVLPVSFERGKFRHTHAHRENTPGKWRRRSGWRFYKQKKIILDIDSHVTVNCFSTKAPKQFYGKGIFLTNGAGITRYSYEKKWFSIPISYHTKKLILRWIIDLNV